MRRFNQLESLLVEHIESIQEPILVQSPDTLSLVLILTGKGYHTINGHQSIYESGDIFFLGVCKEYSFLPVQLTSVYQLSFSSQYITSLLTGASPSWTYLDKGAICYAASLSHDATEQANLRALVGVLLSEERSFRPFISNPIIESLMKTILSLVDRLLAQRVAQLPIQRSYASELTQRIIAYVSRHIGEPDHLRMEAIADAFNYSPGHLSALFKQHAGDSIQQFIIHHKLKLVAMKLRGTPLTISQIAFEFGFSDVCHLNKLFKRYYHYTPTAYRLADAGKRLVSC